MRGVCHLLTNALLNQRKQISKSSQFLGTSAKSTEITKGKNGEMYSRISAFHYILPWSLLLNSDHSETGHIYMGIMLEAQS